jgi:hypothetical protein
MEDLPMNKKSLQVILTLMLGLGSIALPAAASHELHHYAPDSDTQDKYDIEKIQNLRRQSRKNFCLAGFCGVFGLLSYKGMQSHLTDRTIIPITIQGQCWSGYGAYEALTEAESSRLSANRLEKSIKTQKMWHAECLKNLELHEIHKRQQSAILDEKLEKIKEELPEEILSRIASFSRPTYYLHKINFRPQDRSQKYPTEEIKPLENKGLLAHCRPNRLYRGPQIANSSNAMCITTNPLPITGPYYSTF